MILQNWIARYCGEVGKGACWAAMSMLLWLALPVARAATATAVQLQTSEPSVAWGKPILLTAKVTVGSTPVTAGHVLFCNAASATVQLCQGPAVLGQGQLTSSGTAAINLRLGVGTHSIKALFQATAQYAASTSSATTVTVTGTYVTVTSLTASGGAGDYALKATVNGLGSNAVAGTVDFNMTTGTKSTLGTASLGASTPVSGFVAQAPVATGVEPIAMAAGDFNGDGIPDLAVVNITSASLTILIGNGSGGYTATTQVLTTASGPSAIAVGDFNNDGKLDCIVASETANALYEFLGNGDGTFQAPTTPINENGISPVGIVVGDFNSDGQEDLAVVNQSSDTVVILLGNGQGGFAANSVVLATDQTPYAITMGDFNKDGKPDLAIANYYGFDVTVWLGNGDGTFTQAATQAVGVYPTALAVGDFNGDGNLDMAVTNSYSQSISILLGNGQGGFTAQSQAPATELNPDSIATADFNGDGKLDLAVANSNSNSVDVFFGNGNGTFAAYQSMPAGSAPYSILAADVNGDGMADLAVTDAGSNLAEALLNLQGTSAVAILSGVNIPGGGLQSVQANYVGTTTFASSQSNVVAGLSGTLIPTATTETLSTKTPAINQALQIAASISPASDGALMPTGTMNLYDGATLVESLPIVNASATFSTVYPTNGTHSLSVQYSGDANFAASQSAVTAVTVATPLTSATTIAASLATVPHGSPVTFTASVTSGGKPVTAGLVKFCKATATYCEDVAILGGAQLNAAGKAAISLSLPVGANAVKAVFAGTGPIATSSSAATTVTVTGTYPVSLALTNATAGGVTTGGVYSTNVAMTNGSWQSLPAGPLNIIDTSNKNLLLTSTQLPASVSSLVAGTTVNGLPASPTYNVTGDFNGDGKMDVAIANVPGLGSTSTFTLLLSNGNGTFTAKTSSIPQGRIYGMAAGDFNGDGKLDLAVVDNYAYQLYILLGNGDGTFTYKEQFGIVASPQGIAVGDFNNDGNADLVVASNQGAGMMVLLGKGDGTFTGLPVQSANGAYAVSIAVADFNGDGLPDLLMTDAAFGAQVAYGSGEGIFQTPQTLLPEMYEGFSVAVGDFNGDGRPDAVIGVQGQAIILLNQPGGSVRGNFEPASSAITLTAGSFPRNMVVADMNGDGLPDLVTADQNNSSVYVDYNQGNGSFRQVPQNISGQAELGYVAVGDFDLDGGPDLMILEPVTNSAAVLLNRGTNQVQFSGLTVPGSGTHLIEATTPAGGVYAAGVSNTLSLAAAPVPATITLTTTPSSGITLNQQVSVAITAATVDNFAPTGTVSLYQGTTLVKTSALTNGTLTVPMSFATAGEYTLTAKYNGDTNLATASTSLTIDVTTPSTTTLTASAASVPLGTPITLTASVKSTAGVAAKSGQIEFCNAAATVCAGTALLATAQVTSQGTATQKVVLPVGPYAVKAVFTGNSLLMGSTSASLQLSVTGTTATTTVLTSATTATAGTYNLTATVTGKGGYPLTGSVSFVNATANTTLGTGTLGASTRTVAFNGSAVSGLGADPFTVVTGDFNGDGNQDAALVDSVGDQVQILLGNGKGGFTVGSPVKVATQITCIVAGDFNGDGKLDLAVSEQLGSALYILLGNGNGTFVAGKTIAVAAGFMQVADLNHDGNLDIVASATLSGLGVSVLLGDGTGNFTVNPITTGSLTSAGFAALGDFNGDGNLDLALTNFTDTLFIYLGNGAGGFTPATTNPIVGGQSADIQVGDFNKDGKLDLAVASQQTNTLTVLLGTGSGTFTVGSVIPVLSSPAGMMEADVNQDGNADLVLLSNMGTTANYQVLLGSGTGTFTAYTYAMPTSFYTTFGAVADFNNDGLPDVIIPNRSLGTAEVLLNATTTSASATLTGAKVAGTGNQTIEAKYAGATPYAANTSNALTLAP